MRNNLPRKECGTCKFWRITQFDLEREQPGICVYNDMDTYAQQGRGCQDWRANEAHQNSQFYDDYIDPELMKYAEEFMEEYKSDFKALADS